MTLKRPYVAILMLLVAILLVGNWFSQRNTRARATAGKNSLAAAFNPAEVTDLTLPDVDLPSRPTTKPIIYAKSYVLLDDKSKYPLLAKEPDTALPIASTTKVMTALVAIDTLPLDQVVTISNHAATIEGSEIQLLTGEKMSVENLLYAMLLNSANDAAYALSEAAGSREQFVAQMNAKAALLGLHHTHYEDPAGLNDDGHASARDLGNLMLYALNNPTFTRIVTTADHTIWSADSRYKHDLSNSNRLIHPDEPLFYPQAIGGKTGFTYAAGHCLITAASLKDHRKVVAVVLNTTEDTKEASAKEVRKLLTWAENI